MEVLIRPATKADLSSIGRLGAMLVYEHYQFDKLRFLPASGRTAAGYASFLGSQLENPEVIVLVADQAGKTVGYTYSGLEGMDYMSLRGPAGVLYDIIVDPDFRSRGIGRQLLDSTMAELKSRGAPRVVLSTAERNEAGQRLFERAGFRRTMIEMTRELD